jgi:hypothetical protein
LRSVVVADVEGPGDVTSMAELEGDVGEGTRHYYDERAIQSTESMLVCRRRKRSSVVRSNQAMGR